MADRCKEVSPACPVQATTLGYYPNEPLNIFIAVAFGVAAVVTLGFGIWRRTWGYMSFIVAGCALEMAGYAARVALSSNPWNQSAFETQICAIILAPTLICISIYLTLKHVTAALNSSLSRVRPRLYPFIFVPADVSCLLVQAIGGGLAAQGTKNPRLLKEGNRAIIAGIALQVVVLLAFGALSTDYLVRVRRWVKGPAATPEARALWSDRRFRMFGVAMLGAYLCVQIRCVYRVAEMAGGWGNYIMQDQPSFTVLDSFMMLICVYLLACFPPGIFFPRMVKGVAMVSEESPAVERKNAQQDGGQRSGTETKAPTPVRED
ncbi:unnamed protein product [Discula destructiva]